MNSARVSPAVRQGSLKVRITNTSLSPEVCTPSLLGFLGASGGDTVGDDVIGFLLSHAIGLP